MMDELFWLDECIVRAMHADQIAQHGGSAGIRDENLMSASLARPQHLLAYGESPTLSDLAAAYGYGLAKNHPFVDGNKRTAFVAMATFLELNGYSLVAPEPEVVVVMERLGAGLENQETISLWLKENANSQESVP
jgi:death on curing protein